MRGAAEPLGETYSEALEPRPPAPQTLTYGGLGIPEYNGIHPVINVINQWPL